MPPFLLIVLGQLWSPSGLPPPSKNDQNRRQVLSERLLGLRGPNIPGGAIGQEGKGGRTPDSTLWADGPIFMAVL